MGSDLKINGVTARVRPGKAVAIALIVVFQVIWYAVMAMLAGYGVYNLVRR